VLYVSTDSYTRMCNSNCYLFAVLTLSVCSFHSECDCLEEVTTICAMLSAENIWITPPPPSREAKALQLRQQQQQQAGGGRLQMNLKGSYANTWGDHNNNSTNSGGNNNNGADNGRAQQNFLSEEGERARRAHAALSHPYGDFHTYLNVYNTWVANGRSPQWCERNYVNFRSIKTVSNIR
jgi:HrpA-like RNA helicase